VGWKLEPWSHDRGYFLAALRASFDSHVPESEVVAIPQPKVSALLNGRLDGFSTERLFRFLNALGCDVKINVSRPKPRAVGHVQVTAS
jgi:Helix-turn-helix domain